MRYLDMPDGLKFLAEKATIVTVHAKTTLFIPCGMLVLPLYLDDKDQAPWQHAWILTLFEASWFRKLPADTRAKILKFNKDQLDGESAGFWKDRLTVVTEFESLVAVPPEA